MVVFTCLGCGESVKKTQAEKHKSQCRRSEILSCMDCSKDFRGQEYQKHLECISEEQKYGGANYVAKENKGKIKQQSWFEQVQKAIASVESSNTSVLKLLEKLKDYPNIPRKEAKFKNFLWNSLRERNPKIVAEVWAAIAKAEELKKATKKDEGLKTTTADANCLKEAVSDLKTVTVEPDSLKMVPETNGTVSDKVNEKVKLKILMKKLLRESDRSEMKLRKLKKRIATSLNVSSSEEKEKLFAKIDRRLTKSYFVVDGKIVRLKC